MKKIDKKVKSKLKPKTKTVMKQKQKQNQSVVINISQNKAKTRTSAPKTVKPSYLQSITTYPIFREETAQMPLYRNPEPKKEESVFVDKTTLRTELPEHDVFKLRSQTSLPVVNNIDIPIVVKTPVVAVKTPVKRTESQMIEEYDNLYENVVKPKYPRGMRPPLTQEEIQRKKDELNLKRRTEYAIKKKEKSVPIFP
jgi:hypothetical protein